MPEVRDWIGRERRVSAQLDPWPAAAMHALLDLPGDAPGPGDALPPLWSWLYFLETVSQAQLGEDGHPRKGGFLPPVDLPRRMWAGSALEFVRPLTVGEPYVRTSTVAEIVDKSGRSGALCFVTVNHEIAGAGGIAVRERQTIVYREPADPAARPPSSDAPPQSATWRRSCVADPRLLFRYSALTFNAHRIHYDAAYASGEEGYPGLVVHGPLQATLMVELVRANTDRGLAAFEFQGRQPLFAGEPFEVCADLAGDEVALRVQRADGVTASGRATLR